MHQSKLIQSLQYLSPTELKRLLQFLKSPYFNSNKNIVRLYLLLRNHYPEFDSPKLKREKVFKKIFPKIAFDDKKLQNLMVDFRALIDKFLIILQLEKEKIEQHKLLVRAYAERPNCYKSFVKQSKVIHKALDLSPYRDERFFQEKKKMYLMHYSHPGIDIKQRGKKILEQAVGHFEAFKAIAELKLKCAQNARKNSLGETDFNVHVIHENAVLEIYTQLDHLQRSEQDHEKLMYLTKSFTSNIHHFRQEDQSNILFILLNYLARSINAGKSEFIYDSLSLYKIALQHNCLFIQGKLTTETFHNIITVGLSCKEYEWTKNFMEEYQVYLETNKKLDSLALGWGQWYFKTGQLEKAMEILHHPFKNIRYLITSKAMIIRSCFDLIEKEDKYFDQLLNHLEAFDKYIRREKPISSTLAYAYLQFTKYTKKLVSNRKDEAFKLKLREEISAEPNLVLKNWLLEKAQ